jgi:CRISPR-associated protein Csm5
MKYRLTCLTPLLVGDGHRLSPIDYMVWKDQVNVLDQRRIFRLLAKGPRLDGYLSQLKRADKLDFASWGGFAQNFADRRIPFENPALTAYWQRAAGESLHIPTFATCAAGAYLPGSAIKGVLRTGLMFSVLKESALAEVAARLQTDRPPRNPAEGPEDHAIGNSGASRMRVITAGDSAVIDRSQFKVYLLRVSTLESRAPGSLSLAWKQSPRGSVDARRVEDSTPWFAEMAVPGTVIQGDWKESSFFSQPEIWRALRWGGPMDRVRIFRGANAYAAQLLAVQKQYAERSGLRLLAESIAGLEARLEQVSGDASGRACLVSMGWGSGLLAKTPWLRTDDEAYRQVMRHIPIYERAIRSGLPFPKTRRIVFLGNQPAALPGWALLEVSD